jgi:PPOX class probable F420-dependent enzyme
MPDYGVPETRDGMLPWRHAQERLERALNYWVCTTRPEGRPHAAPVWGAWVDDRLYFSTGSRTQRVRNLARNPAVAVHLESGSDVVIVEGVAELVTSLDAALYERVAASFAARYDGYRPDPPSAEGGWYVVRPQRALAWSTFPTDVTRWVFRTGTSQGG